MVRYTPRALLFAFLTVANCPHLALAQEAGGATTFKAGFAERDITPEIGMEAPGGYGKAYHRALHDACKARAAVFDDGQTRVAIVGLDLLMIRRPSVEAVRRRIHERCGLAPEAILIAASHSHSAGPVGILPGEYDHASAFVQSLAYEKSTTTNPEYMQRVETAIVDAVCAADAARVESRAGAGVGTEDKAAFNRRFHMRSGLTMTHPRQGNPDIVESAGPIDPGVGVIGAWNRDGKLLGCVVNYACHATTGPGGISADYIYYLEKTIRGLMGDEVIVVFVPGAGGDVTQVDNLSPYDFPQFGEVAARRVGGRVGAEALRTLLSMAPGNLAPLRAENHVLKIKRRAPKPERVAAARATVERAPSAAGSAAEWTFAKETVLLDAIIAKEPIADVEVQAMQIGPAILLACPAEYFCSFGLELKARSKFAVTMPVSMANGCVGYVPNDEAFGPRGGGYETRLTSYSNLEPTAGRQIAAALLELSGDFTPAAMPTPPPAPPFRSGPWDYGSVPPELE